jgi:hypothetical protein
MILRLCSRLLVATLASLALGAAAADPPPPMSPVSATRVLDQASAQRLLRNKGLTLQWIDWNTRGRATVSRAGRLWTLQGTQAERRGPGRLVLDGTISEIGSDYFIFDGTIRIAETPDKGRLCEQTKTWRFAITQNRRFFRLREFEWCDGLTDYVDIYF